MQRVRLGRLSVRCMIEENFPSRSGWSRELPVVIVVRAIRRRHPRVPWRRHARRHTRGTNPQHLNNQRSLFRVADKSGVVISRRVAPRVRFRRVFNRFASAEARSRARRACAMRPRRGRQPSAWTCPLAMRSALVLVFLLGSASAKGYNRSRTKLAIPKYIGSPPADRGPTARIVGGASP